MSLDSYHPYVSDIETFVCKLLDIEDTDEYNSEICSILNGQPSRAIRNLISIARLKQLGIFFTDHRLADRLIEYVIPDIENGAIIADPTCGVGNLLLACAKHFPIKEDLAATLNLWGGRLKGFDLHPEFIRATKARLALLAIKRGARSQTKRLSLEHIFPNIHISDGLAKNSLHTNCIVINPPYSLVQAPDKCTWSSGKVSQAALFLEKYVSDALPSTRIVALLPDVLRTGSRYIKWRKLIEKSSEIEGIEIIGQFDRLTDIDVFILRLKTGSSMANRTAQWWDNDKFKLTGKSIGDLFKVSIGAVVPHRDPKKGVWVPYIHARTIPSWSVVNIDNGFPKRRFSGTTFIPPFVVVRRTSRPGDEFRATGTIIVGSQPVAVENHLVIMKPYSNNMRDCELLIDLLQVESSNDFLNERIRCRHLTTSSLKEMPWVDGL